MHAVGWVTTSTSANTHAEEAHGHSTQLIHTPQKVQPHCSADARQARRSAEKKRREGGEEGGRSGSAPLKPICHALWRPLQHSATTERT
jgi:hypothetical protein